MPASSKFVAYLNADFEDRKRTNARYSLRAYAKRLGIASSLLSRLLRGQIPVTLKMLSRLATDLRLSPDQYAEFAAEIRQQMIERRSEATSVQGTNTHRALIVVDYQAELSPKVLEQIANFDQSLKGLALESPNHRDGHFEVRISFTAKERS